MRISRQKLRSIIMRECEMMDHGAEGVVDLTKADTHPVEPMVESPTPETDLMVEIEVASRALEQVVESVQNAAHLCPDCGNGISAQTPIMEAMVTQAEALQEMIEAQAAVIVESADMHAHEETVPEISLVEI